MAIHIVSESFQRLWDEWNLRGAVLVSLWLQILLIFLSPLRKRSRSCAITMIIWSAYLTADWIAAFAIGLISVAQSDECDKASVNPSLAAFWAPFLLLHLGGPDSITAFALEDNELWIRHLFSLIVELLMVFYVFSLAFPNAFWLPTIVVFVAGTIKYIERTRAFYLACLGSFKDSIHSNTMEHAQVPVDMKEIQVVQDGYKFYKMFRGLVVDHMLSFDESRESREFFTQLNQEDAFKVMEVELNFMYDELFTKTASLHRGRYGYFFRFICTVLIVVALLLFPFEKKSNIHKFDIAVTYALLISAIILDFVSLLKIFFSNWMIVILKHSKALGVIYSIQKSISFGARWSERVSQHNLISFCLKKRIEWLDATIDYFGLSNLFQELWNTKYKRMNKELKEFIFNTLKERAEIPQTRQRRPNVTTTEIAPRSRRTRAFVTMIAPRIEAAPSTEIIREIPGGIGLVGSIDVLQYHKKVLAWHIATDLLYFTLDDHHHHRETCKILSDYMLYLLVMRPALTPAVAGFSEIRYQETCKETMKLIHNDERSISGQREACEKLLSQEYTTENRTDLSHAGIALAKKLRTISDKNNMWEMMSKIWLDLLCYVAIDCGGFSHAQQLSHGGELITFVWLLLAHLGLGGQFKEMLGRAKAPLFYF